MGSVFCPRESLPITRLYITVLGVFAMEKFMEYVVCPRVSTTSKMSSKLKITLLLLFLESKLFLEFVPKYVKRYEIFAKGIAELNSTPTSLIKNINDNTILCRCEDITKKDIKNAVNNGAKNLNQIKSWTRFGMGPCQGRTCQYSVAKVASEQLKCNVKDLGY